MRLGLFKKRYHLIPRHAGKPIEKYFNGITGFQMFEEAGDRHARSAENRLASQDFGILMDNLAHGVTLAGIP
jgi:hypothetical protein